MSGDRNMIPRPIDPQGAALWDANERAERNLRMLRDEFAMATLTGLLANPYLTDVFAGFAAQAYTYADAMLKERGK